MVAGTFRAAANEDELRHRIEQGVQELLYREPDLPDMSEYWTEDCRPDPVRGPPLYKVPFIARNLKELIEGSYKLKPVNTKWPHWPRKPEEILRTDRQFGIHGVIISKKKTKQRIFNHKYPKLMVPIFAPTYLVARVKWFAGRMMPWEDAERIVMKLMRRVLGPGVAQRLLKQLGNDFFDHPPEWIVEARKLILTEILYPIIEQYIDKRAEYLKRFKSWQVKLNPDVIEMAKAIMYVYLVDYAVNAKPALPYGSLISVLLPYLGKDKFEKDEWTTVAHAMLLLNDIGLLFPFDLANKTYKVWSLSGMLIMPYPALLMNIFVLLDWFGYAFRRDASNLETLVFIRNDFQLVHQSMTYWTCARVDPNEKLHPWHMLQYFGVKRDEVEAYMTYVEDKIPPPPEQKSIRDVHAMVEEVMKRFNTNDSGAKKLLYVYAFAKFLGVDEKLMNHPKIGSVFSWLVNRIKYLLGGLYKYAMAVVQIVHDKWAGTLWRTVKSLVPSSRALSVGTAQIPSSQHASPNDSHTVFNPAFTHKDEDGNYDYDDGGGGDSLRGVMRRALERLLKSKRHPNNSSGRDG